ncbi:hypothetical protein MKW94_002074 [Papaver nudicaule]|uniref:CP12 domain-containing protein n=1 Tax=Papaver nudicaule TaxID=74823 RepID=A0AA42B2Y4_PAPNU|nr:hypothetical protein [Papaver nudicaule]
MAAITALNISSTANKNRNLFPSSISLIPDNFHKLTSVSFPNQNRKIENLRLFTVRAMGGGVKFKGTVEKDKQLSEMIEKKVQEATQVCGENNPISDECKVAWDEVEEISQAKADFRKKIEKEDPLESFCNENPETDECRVYED